MLVQVQVAHPRIRAPFSLHQSHQPYCSPVASSATPSVSIRGPHGLSKDLGDPTGVSLTAMTCSERLPSSKKTTLRSLMV